jgi:transcriptional regulator with XRE-family HTH domain
VRRTELSRLRKALGYSRPSLAAKVGCSEQSVKRWELGLSDVSPEYRESLAEALSRTAHGKPARKVSPIELEAILNGNKNESHLKSGWWSNYETMEQSATCIRTWETILVPGLLQTREYAGAILKNEDLLERRMHRQELVPRIELRAVVDESVLFRPIGGRYVLAGQLRHLVDMNERENVSVRILPLDCQDHPAAWGSLAILEFPWPGGLVYLQHTGGSHSLDSSDDIHRHIATFDELQSRALNVADSNNLLIRRGKELTG